MMYDQAERLRDIVHESLYREIAKLNSYVICVTSGKGGSGKTNIALNLGIALGQRGRKVLIYDADFNLANLDILLGLSPKYRILDYIRGKVGLEDIVVNARRNLKVIPANSGVVDFNNVKAEKLIEVIVDLNKAGNEFDFVLIDTPAGISDVVVDLIGFSDSYIVVVMPEPTSLMDAYAVIKFAFMRSGKKNAKVIVNGVSSEVEALDVARRLSLVAKKFLGVKVDYIGSVPFDVAVSRSVKAQKPFIELYPAGDASMAVRKIADKIINLNGIKKPKNGRLIEV